jgi:hypothetical protein
MGGWRLHTAVRKPELWQWRGAGAYDGELQHWRMPKKGVGISLEPTTNRIACDATSRYPPSKTTARPNTRVSAPVPGAPSSHRGKAHPGLTKAQSRGAPRRLSDITEHHRGHTHARGAAGTLTPSPSSDDTGDGLGTRFFEGLPSLHVTKMSVAPAARFRNCCSSRGCL